MDYFISDLHLFHNNITGAEGFEERRRGFADVTEMGDEILKNWNNKIISTDTVHILGDVSLSRKPKKVFDYLNKLNGTIIIYKGNHDHSKLLNYLETNNFMYDNKPKYTIHQLGDIMKAHGYILHLSHYPILTGYRPNMISVHGHIHSLPSRESYMVNVGVDSLDLPEGQPFGEPISLDTLVEIIKNKYDHEQKSKW